MSSLDFYPVEGVVCFDVGAHIGESSSSMLLIGAKKIYAIEPVKESFIQLTNTFSDRTAREKVVCINKAAWSFNGPGKVSVCKYATSISTVSQHWKKGRFKEFHWDGEQNVEFVTLDSLIKEYEMPYFIKIDVEGGEVDVLSGLSHVVPAINFEYTAEFIENAVECVNILGSFAEYSFAYSMGNEARFTSPWMNAKELYNDLTTKCLLDRMIYGNIGARLSV